MEMSDLFYICESCGNKYPYGYQDSCLGCHGWVFKIGSDVPAELKNPHGADLLFLSNIRINNKLELDEYGLITVIGEDGQPAKINPNHLVPIGKRSPKEPCNPILEQFKYYFLQRTKPVHWEGIHEALLLIIQSGNNKDKMSAMRILMEYSIGKPVQRVDVVSQSTTIDPEQAKAKVLSFFGIDAQGNLVPNPPKEDVEISIETSPKITPLLPEGTPEGTPEENK